ncbi:AT-hook motif nuclear-localized protein [Forsythia ovata]|uniref:AT-hook motif nuclear-localized protein n=1 Tax=Forsythia ovata TaxID=205694 RepID=A0ABD1W635_9LAMI
MDQLTAQGRPLSPPFHARDLQLHHHLFQHRQQNLEDEQSENNNINCILKRDWDKNYSVSTATAGGRRAIAGHHFFSPHRLCRRANRVYRQCHVHRRPPFLPGVATMKLVHQLTVRRGVESGYDRRATSRDGLEFKVTS